MHAWKLSSPAKLMSGRDTICQLRAYVQLVASAKALCSCKWSENLFQAPFIR